VKLRFHDVLAWWKRGFIGFRDTLGGLIIMALPAPGVAAHRIIASPFGAASQDEWSLAAMLSRRAPQ
jgi:hypothetical protein